MWRVHFISYLSWHNEKGRKRRSVQVRQKHKRAPKEPKANHRYDLKTIWAVPGICFICLPRVGMSMPRWEAGSIPENPGENDLVCFRSAHHMQKQLKKYLESRWREMWREVAILRFYGRVNITEVTRKVCQAHSGMQHTRSFCYVSNSSFLFFRSNVVGEAYQSKRQLTFIFNSESDSASPLFLHSHSYHDYLEHLDESHAVGTFLNKEQQKVTQLAK